MSTLDTRAIISSFAPFGQMMLEAERIMREFEEHFQWINIPNLNCYSTHIIWEYMNWL